MVAIVPRGSLRIFEGGRSLRERDAVFTNVCSRFLRIPGEVHERVLYYFYRVVKPYTISSMPDAEILSVSVPTYNGSAFSS